MTTDNAERIVLITGANRGIGLDTANQLAKRGFHVVIAARDEASGERATEGINASGDKSSSCTWT